ncbi:MAG: glycosyltransferase family 2 protein, partial [Steroidobacteraceae bacterium]
TDGDCIPRADWIASIKRAFGEGAEFLAGRIGFRSDDCRLSAFEHATFSLIAGLMAQVAPFLPHNRDGRYLAPYVMAGGGNLAITAPLYLRSGGFPRIRLEEDNDDRGLTNRVRLLTARVVRDRRIVVDQSARRVKQYGVRNSILWYMNRRYRPDNVDVR